MVCIQCYLPPIIFMIYMKFLHPFLAPFLEPAIDKVVGLIWGPEAVQRGCPIKPKPGSKTPTSEGGDPQAGPSSSSSSKIEPQATEIKSKDD